MNYLDIYHLLNKSNCGKCATPTCLAFAISVARGEREIVECPFVDKKVAENIAGRIDRKDWKRELIESLRREVSHVDLGSVAEGIGAVMSDDRLNITCLGNDFQIDTSGRIYTTGHINSWIEILLLHYVRTGGSSALTGKWVSFDELRGGMVKATSFKRDCEEPVREMIDRQPEHFFDLLSLLGGRAVEEQSADHALLIFPLPRIPFLILYWCPDEDFGSTVKILFDSTADEYLDVESLIFLGEGLVEMFRRKRSGDE